MKEPRTPAELHAGRFLGVLREIQRDALTRGVTVPDRQTKERAADAFWKACDAIRELAAADEDVPALKSRFFAAVGPLLFRSRIFWHSYYKPYGYAGDFALIELLYDLESGAGEQPFQTCVNNCLDHVFSTVPSAPAFWERRHWLRDLLLRESASRGHKLRILDIACGGVRYQRDYLASIPDPAGVELTLVDQDPAALAFATKRQLRDFQRSLRPINVRLADLRTRLPPGRWDVIISAGLFDYLDQTTAREFVGFFHERLNPGGVLAITNFGHDERMQFVLEWIGDWPLVWRSREDMADIFSGLEAPSIQASGNRALWLADIRRGAAP